MQDEERAGILYYARERQYRHIYTSALELTRRHGAQPELVFWKAYSLVMEGRESEGMREVESVQETKELSLATKLLLIFAHKKCKVVDREAVQMLESRIRSERTGSGERALYHAALFLWLSGRHDKSREYADRLLKMAPSSIVGLSLRGWIDLTCGRETLVKKSIKYFEEAAAVHSKLSPGSPAPVDVLLGKTCYYYLRHNFSHSLELASQAVAAHPRFLPPLVEKMRIQLALQDWDQAIETAQRCLSQDASCVEAHRVLILELLARRGDHSETITTLGDLLTQLDQCEPKNHWIYHNSALSPARLAGGDTRVLQQTMALVERAVSLSPHSALYLNELAYQQLLSGKIGESLTTYKKAFSVDETSVEALAGLIHCQLLSGLTVEAEQQLEFLAEVQSSIGKQAHVLYLNVLLGQRRDRPQSEILPLILETRDLHIRGLKGQPLGCRYFELYNPQFLLWIAQTLVVYAPTEPALTPAQAHPSLPQAAAILESVLMAAPALSPALLLLARVKYLSGEMAVSQSLLTRCIRLDASSTEAHLLMAQIQLHTNNPLQSQSSLEMALSHSFQVKGQPLFHLISGRVQRALGHAPEALTSLQAALKMSGGAQLPGVARGGKAGLGASERATVYLELVDVLTKLGRQHEAAKTMQDAIHEFSGTPEEIRISIANADLALERGDTETALTMLKTVTEDKPYYLQAKQKMADIYLVHRKDRRQYIACFRDLAEKMAGPPTALMLGDAFMNIQEPEEALSVYEKSLKKNPRDSVLASKVGQALVKTHQYTKAISYYEAALKSDGLQPLRADLARLYLRLGHFDRAEKTLLTALSLREGSEVDMGTLCGSVELLLLLAEVRERGGREKEGREALGQARETQAKVLKKASVGQPDSLPQHKKKAANIASQLAKASTTNKDWVTGIQYCREALLHCETDLRARVALSRALLASGDQEESEEECAAVLRADPNHRDGCMLMAELMVRKANYEKAVEQYQNLLSKTPDYFPALAQLVEVGRRWGRLNAVAPYVDQATGVCSRPDSSPGLHYCRGLLTRYQGNTREALVLLNKARRDGGWGHGALVCMVDMCVNPDCEVIGGETTRANTNTEGSSQREEQSTAIATAQKLLKEARPKTVDEEVKVRQLEGWVLLATRSKVDAEQALGKFMEMATTKSGDNVGALVGVATAHMILKQTPRARNQLKRIAKTPWTSQEAEWFERGWLLLADVYIQTGKYDMAIELLKKCLQYNQSCSRAWEYMGFISEKEQAYRDAAANYEKAWRYSSHSNPTIGYRLAFNYLKVRRFVEAIDVCHAVLERYPTYPKIQREILDKARQSLRV